MVTTGGWLALNAGDGVTGEEVTGENVVVETGGMIGDVFGASVGASVVGADSDVGGPGDFLLRFPTEGSDDGSSNGKKVGNKDGVGILNGALVPSVGKNDLDGDSDGIPKGLKVGN